MTTLSGLGIWIWEWNRCDGGDLDAIVRRALVSGVAWVAVKAGEARANGQVTRARVEALRKAGIECAAWWSSRPDTAVSELDLVRGLVDSVGVRHLIQNADVDWESVVDANGNRVPHDFRADAASFAAQLREVIGRDVFLADTPWARPKSRGSKFPYAEFGAVTDARFPKLYWRAAGVPARQFLDASDQQWAPLAAPESISPVGSLVDEHGTSHAPVSELRTFLDHYADRRAVSLWCWEHLNPKEWSFLEIWAGRQLS